MKNINNNKQIFRIVLSVTIICLKLKAANYKKRDRLLREHEKRHFFNQLIIPCHLILSHFYFKKNTNGASDKSRNCGRTERIMARFVLNAPASRVGSAVTSRIYEHCHLEAPAQGEQLDARSFVPDYLTHLKHSSE